MSQYPLLTFNHQSRHPELLGTPQLLPFEGEATTRRCSLVVLKGPATTPGEFTLGTGQENQLLPGSKASRCTHVPAMRHWTTEVAQAAGLQGKRAPEPPSGVPTSRESPARSHWVGAVGQRAPGRGAAGHAAGRAGSAGAGGWRWRGELGHAVRPTRGAEALAKPAVARKCCLLMVSKLPAGAQVTSEGNWELSPRKPE